MEERMEIAVVAALLHLNSSLLEESAITEFLVG
jgi:hypothetical protein